MRIEIRTCVKCGETKEILQKHKHATNVCRDCQREASKHYQRAEAIREGKRIGTTGRVPYPLEEPFKTTGNYFKSLASKTNKCKTKEEWRELMQSRLINLSEDVLKWINAHDGEETKDKKEKSKNEYSDMSWEDFERGGWGDNIDS